MAPATSPVPQDAETELRRVVRRWQQLPLDHALARLPAVRAAFADLGGAAVADLGPAAAMDQLTVLVYDAAQAGRGASLAPALAALRRALD